jgi:hypothetical protein
MPLEPAQIRRRVQTRLADLKRGAAARRDNVASAERAWTLFLANVATPTLTTVAQSLSAEGHPYRVTTPGNAVRMASERSGRSYLEIRLDTSTPAPQVVAEICRERGSRVVTEDRPIGEALDVEGITDEQLLAFILEALGDLIER